MSELTKKKTNVKTHKDLDVWKKSMDLVEEVYRFTQGFPGSEKYGLINQIRRCAISVPSNIAEGSARNTSKETTQFCYIALGSLAELETQLLIAERLKYYESTNILDNVIEIRRMLLGLIKYLKSK